MKTKKVASYFVFAVMGLSMFSCADLDYDTPKIETYTRSFIKEFGLVNPEQDWTMAKADNVKLDLGSKKAGLVKVYGKYGSKYYLVARLENISGTVEVPVDIPKNCKDALVEVDGTPYYGTFGQTISCPSHGVKSRAGEDYSSISTFSTVNSYCNKYPSHYTNSTISMGGWNFVVSENQTENNSYFAQQAGSGYSQLFNTQQLEPIIAASDETWGNYYSVDRSVIDGGYRSAGNGLTLRTLTGTGGFVPEIGTPGQTKGNQDRNGVVEDFLIDMSQAPGGILTVHPYFYGTNLIHILGVYPVDLNGEPYRDSSGNILKYPIYIDKQGDDIMLKGNNSSLSNQSAGITLTTSSASVLNATATQNGPEVYVNKGSTVKLNIKVTDQNNNDVTNRLKISIKNWNEGICSIDSHGVVTPTNKGDGWVDIYWGDFNYLTEWTPDTRNKIGSFHLFVRDEDTASPAQSDDSEMAQGTINYGTENLCPDAYVDGSELFELAGMPWENIQTTYVNDTYCHGVGSFDASAQRLAKTRGYDVKITDAQGNYYIGYLGMYIDVYNNSKDQTMTNDNFKYTLYSQKSLNTSNNRFHNNSVQASKYNFAEGEFFEYSYACVYDHPISKRTFLSFEDMLILHPSFDDVSNLGNKGTSDYEYKAFAANEVDVDNKYSSDRDLNDIVFLVNVDLATIKKTTDVKKDDEGFPWIWALEDLGSTDDFDFNDMVMEIRSITTTLDKAEGGSEIIGKKLKFTPLAAGGTLPIYVHFKYGANDYILKPGEHDLTGSHTLSTTTGDEFHTWFGVNNPSTMINTGAYYTTVKKPCTLLVDKDDFSFCLDTESVMKTADGNAYSAYFYVTINGPTVTKNSQAIDADRAQDVYSVGLPTKGAAAQSFIIWSKNQWEWPSERQHISIKYPGFKKWIETPTYDWLNNPDKITN